MSTVPELFQSREFRSADRASQRDALAQIHPGFMDLPPDRQDVVIDTGLERYPADQDMLGNYIAGVNKGFANEIHFASNAMRLVMPGDMGDRAISELADFSAKLYEDNELPKDHSPQELAAHIAGELTVMVPSAMTTMGAAKGVLKGFVKNGMLSKAAAEMLAPSLGFGMKAAIGASDRGFIPTMQAGLTESAFAALFPLTQHLPRIARGTILGGAAYALTPENAPQDERIAGAITMAGLAAWPKSRGAIDPILKIQGKELSAAKEMRIAKDNVEQLHTELAEQYETQRQDILEMEKQSASPGGGRKRTPEQPGIDRVDIEHDAPARGGPQPDGGRAGERTATGGASESLDNVIVELGDRFNPRDPADVRGKKYSHGREIEHGKEPSAQLGVIRHQDILTKLAKSLDASFKYGGVKNKASDGVGERLGYMRHSHKSQSGQSIEQFSESMRIRHMSDIPTQVHEVGHFLSMQTPMGEAMHNNAATHSAFYGKNSPNIKIQNMPNWQQEMHHLSYDVRNVEEGFAELTKHWFTNRPYLEVVAPNALAKFELAMKVLPKKLQKELNQTREQIGEWYGQGALSIAKSKIGAPASDPTNTMSNALDRYRQTYVDDLHGVLNMVRKLGINVPDNVWETFRRLRANAAIVESMWKNGAPVEVWEFPNKPAGQRGRSHYEWKGDGPDAILRDMMKEATHNNKGERQSGKEALDEFKLFLNGMHAADLRSHTIDPTTNATRRSTERDRQLNRTREKLFDQKEIAAMLKLKTPAYKKAFKRLQQYQSDVADFAQSMGLFSAEQRGKWMRQLYASSSHREMQAEKKGLGGTIDPLAGSMGIHRTYGDTRNVRDPVQNIIDAPAKLIIAALENNAKLELVDIGNITSEMRGGFADIPKINPEYFRGPQRGGVKGAGRFLERIAPRHERVVLPKDELVKAFDTEINRLWGVDKPAELALARKWLGGMPEDIDGISHFLGASRPLQRNIMTVFRNGHKEYYQINDPLLVRAIESITRPTQEGVVKFFAKARSLKQDYITTEPGFWMANLVRDTAMAAVMTKTGFPSLAASLNGMQHVMRNSKEYKEAQLNGMAGATLREGWESTNKFLIKKSQQDRMNPQGLIFGPVTMWRALRHIGQMSENFNRTGEYIRGVKKGMGHKHSAFLGRELATDFSSHGDAPASSMANFANQSIPFFRAMISGTDRMYRAALTDPSGKAAVATKLGIIGLMSAALETVNHEGAKKYGHLLDEDGNKYFDYLDQPDWQLFNYWNWYVPYEHEPSTGEPTKFFHLHMPKLWDAGLIGTWAEQVTKRIRGDMDDQEMAYGFTEALLGNFNVHMNLGDDRKGASGSPFPFPLPAGIDLLYEQVSNKVAFTGSDIIPPSLENILPEFQERPNQSQAMKLIGKYTGRHLGVGAARGEVLLRGMFGHWASTGLQLASKAWFFENPETSVPFDDLMGIRRFVSRPGKHSKVKQEFYDSLKHFRDIKNTAFSLNISAEDRERLHNENEVAIGASLFLTRGQRSLSSYSREITRLYNGASEPHASPQERFHLINKLNAERAEIMRYYNEQVSEMEEEEKINKKRRSER